ncbi:phage virion morphogenesis protein [Methyloglobulus sp.]|uniref:phage virion morphogenesis protein n=1 Tax=Methyloglobulus sp. TaxID=2518622 RepID=UPI00398A3EC9
MIEVKFDDTKVRQALQGLQQAAGNIAPALRGIGEALAESTKKRFGTTTGPDGEKWAENKPSTLARKKGSRPLTGETRELMDSINSLVFGNDELAVGSPMEYAAMQQFGGTKSEFPNLWADIPARPFLGISPADEAKILAIIEEHLLASIR